MLGSFHTFMNLLAAIGTLMEGSGFRNIMEVVYGSKLYNILCLESQFNGLSVEIC